LYSTCPLYITTHVTVGKVTEMLCGIEDMKELLFEDEEYK
jgi:hypothetical protein